MRNTSHLLIRALLFGLLISTASAQNGGFNPPNDHWFEWRQNNQHADLSKRCDIDKALFDQFTRTLQRLGTTWSRTPEATGPDLYAEMAGIQNLCIRGPLRGQLEYWPWLAGDFKMEPVPGQPGRTRPHFLNETLKLVIYVNKLDGLTSITEMNEYEKLEFGYAKVSRRFSGYPVYDVDHVLLITAPGREPFVAVSLDEALHAWQKISGGIDYGMPSAQTLLSRLSASELQQPAYYYQDSLTSHRGIVASPGKDTFPVLRYNRDYFDKTKPRWVAQILAVDVHFLNFIPPSVDDPNLRGYGKISRRTLEATDWRAMAAELMH